jgi:lysozyme family protein
VTPEQRWALCVHHVLTWETGGDLFGGAPHLDPDDPGGFTKWGISKRRFPKVDVPALTRAQAEALYRQHYWDELRCGEMPAGVALALFDYAVPCGPPRAARALQRAVGAEIDGRVGPKTLQALQRASALEVVSQICMQRAAYFVGLGLARARDISPAPGLQLESPHLTGWQRRLADTAVRAGALAATETQCSR